MTTQKPPLPPVVHTRGGLAFSHSSAWTDADGDLYGLIDLGAVDLTFRTPGQVRDLIAYLAALAGEMDAEITRHVRELLPQTTLHEPERDSDTQPDPYIDAIAAEHVQEYEPALAEPACGRCGATFLHGVLITSDGVTRCHNHVTCAERVAARDAEAAQVTR